MVLNEETLTFSKTGQKILKYLAQKNTEIQKRQRKRDRKEERVGNKASAPGQISTSCFVPGKPEWWIIPLQA